MKVAFIVNSFPAITNTFILNQIVELVKLGIDIEIFSKYTPKKKIMHKDVEKYNLLERTHYFSIPSNLLIRVLKAIYLFLVNFSKDPIKLVKSLNVFKYKDKVDKTFLKNLFLIIPFLGKKFDIIHCHFGNVGNIGVLLKKLGFQGKLVVSFYGYDLTKIIKKYGNNYYDQLFKYGDLFLPICKYFKDIMINLGCKTGETEIHPLGIDTKRFKKEKSTDQDFDKINILTIGRFVEKKGYEYSIKAISKLKAKGYNFNYYIIGNGQSKNKYEKLVQDLKLMDSIVFLGILNQEEVINAYRKCHIFLLPSITTKDGDQEGTPTVLLEAQSMGLPVISSLHSGIPEIVIDEKTGFLVKEKDIDKIVEKLEILIENPLKREEMGNSGIKLTKENFDINFLVKKLLKKYRNLLYNI